MVGDVGLVGVAGGVGIVGVVGGVGIVGVAGGVEICASEEKVKGIYRYFLLPVNIL